MGFTKSERLVLIALCLGSMWGIADASPPELDGDEKQKPWVAEPEVIADYSRRYDDSNFEESKVPPWTLPPLLKFADGEAVTTPADWTRRRNEVLALFQSEVFGVSPSRPEGLVFRVIETNPLAMAGAATLKVVEVSFPLDDQVFAFQLTVFVPNQRSGPVPVFVLLNHRGLENTDPLREKRSEFWSAEQVILRGYAIAAINVAADVDPDNARATKTQGVRAFFRDHHPQAKDFTWGTLAAWAWSGSRAVDYFLSDADLDGGRIALVGHSRSGKAALWAAAADDRFALVCVNGAGEGGPAIARRDFGNKIVHLTQKHPHWFTPRYAHYAGRENELPIDSHQLIALVAPRAYHGGDGARDLWADPRGSWLALFEASAAWELLGEAESLHDPMPPVNAIRVHGPLAYHIRAGGHDLTAFDWEQFLDHADAVFQSR